MSKDKELKTPLKRGKASFTFVGEAKLNQYTYKIDEVSKSGWQYNVLNLGIDCGKGNVVYSEMMGGFSTVKPTALYVNDKDDFKNNYQIDFEDRFIPAILEGINKFNFIKVGIEKDASGKTFTKEFLSEYDAIAYVNDHLEEGMVLYVKGDLKYQMYNGDMQIKKEIKSIFLSKAEPEEYRATFVQSLVITENSLGKLDKENATYPVDAQVLDYAKMWGDKEIKTTIPFQMSFELEVNKEKPEVTKALIKKFFTVAPGEVDEIAVEGNLIEGQQTEEVTEADIPEEMQDLIDLNILSKEEVLSKLVVNGDRVQRYVITKPYVQVKGRDEERKLVLFQEKGKFTPADLFFDFMYSDDEDGEEGANDQGDLADIEEATGDDWMAALQG